MNIRQFRYSLDNLGYVIHDENKALAVDPGAVDEISSYIKEKNLNLEYVVNTHSHPDHTAGTKDVINRSGATLIDNSTLRNQGEIKLGDTVVKVYHTPGHTMDSLCFHVGDVLITGDTLFNGTVGNCFSNDLNSFYRSIRYLMDLPDETVILAGHDYVKASMEFAKTLEPDNPHLNRFLESYDPDRVQSTLAEERLVNPYLRFNEPTIVALLDQKGLPTKTEYNRWESIMSI